ncbi:MAG: alanyl-tRNA editing protein, partial [Oscillospiraceae bacterium]|nr:alanyl-tRNA editing protein [Oscillospiraceae bacterium]
MEPTKRIFDEDAYITEFEAKVLSSTETEKGFDTVLDSTAFFPEGGGQYPDKGTLNGFSVLDVQEDKEGVIHHLLEKEIPEGENVFGKINWEQRFDFMQQHSG